MSLVDQQNAIGVFDSGVGGISTLRTLTRMLPHEDFIFYGDSANAPYGEKSASRVYDLTRAAVDHLREHHVKAVVIACNTATSAAKPELMKLYTDLPFLGIEPATKQAVDSGKKNILVMATPLTLNLDKFHQQEERFGSRANIYPLPCPRLAGLIEKGPAGLPEIRSYLTGLLSSARESWKQPLDAAVLGCTHYPFIADIIAEQLGSSVELFTGYEGLGRNLKRQLANHGLLRAEGSSHCVSHTQSVEFMSSKNTADELALYRRLFEHGFSD